MASHGKLVKAIQKVAIQATKIDRAEEARRARPWPHRRALLIVNSKSGPNRDSLSRTRELVDLLGAYNIAVDVRIKLSKKQAARDARAAAKAGCKLVLAAGGDGTVEAIARGLLDSRAALGIIPLGTYNNIAHSLGVPTQAEAACALIASGVPRPIDVGQVHAHGMKEPRIFLEMATVGVGALLAPLGQHVEKHRLAQAIGLVAPVVTMEPTGMQVKLDDQAQPWWTHTMLLTISNTPRAGAAMEVCTEARVDDGLLDLVIYDGLRQSDLIARLSSLHDGAIERDARVHHTRARSIDVFARQPMPVAAGSKLLGTTPVRFNLRTGALQAIVGHGPGLARPATNVLPVPIVENNERATAPLAANGPTAHSGLRALAGPMVEAATAPLARALTRLSDRR